MKALSIIVIQLFFFCLLTFSCPFVTDLVCEYHTNPIGIDVTKPRLSWQIKTSKENFKQIAYEIRVGENIDNKTVKAIIWSSGKIVSDQSVNVEYEGEPLKSMQRAYWQVRIWDNDNRVSDWSEIAFWEMGILDSKLWSAKWICRPNSDDNVGQVNYFRNEFTVNKKIKSARVYVTSLGIYQLFINGKKISDDLFTPGWTAYEKRLQYQTYDVIDVVDDVNSIGVILGEGWYSGPLGDNEGLLPTMAATATGLLGMLAGKLLMSDFKPMKKVVQLLIAGVAFMIIGQVWNLAFPINKNLWSSSFVCWVGGLSLLLLAVFYLIIDVLKWQKWSFFFMVIGMNPITIYLAMKVIRFDAATKFFFEGIAALLPEPWRPLVLSIGFVAVAWTFLYILYKKKIFLKV